ncbi:MAG: hypothetical protein AAGF33_18435 [Pseudomonadota bacterium]
MRRPYFNKSIEELEQIYDAKADDPAVCQILLEELSHRNTQRARSLF